MAAFNVELEGGDVEIARDVAAGLRESGGGLPGVRAIGLALSERPWPGLDQRPRPARDAARQPWSRRCARWPPPSARALSRLSWSASSPSAALIGYPERRADPGLRPRAPRDRAADGVREPIKFLPMAQTKKKRRRKHRGTQGGRIDSRRRTPVPAVARRRRRRPGRAAQAPASRSTCRRPGAAPRSVAPARR